MKSGFVRTTSSSASASSGRCSAIGSGVAPLVFQWFDDSPVQREVFENIPSAWKLGFYTLLPVVFVYGAVMFANRVKNWERGAPDARETNLKTAPKRFADFRAGVYMQTLLRDPAAGLMHSLIYFSFLILFAVTAVSADPGPGAGGLEVPPRPHVPGVFVRR